MFHPFGYPIASCFQPPPDPNAWMGKTTYRYWTPDGGPPMDGKVPTGSAFDPPPNPFCQAPSPPYLPGFCSSAPAAPSPCYYPSSAPAPAPVCCARPPRKCTDTRPPTPPSSSFRPSDEFYSTGQRGAPLEANRVKGQLPKFENGMNYIFPKNHCTLHVFENNIIQKYAPNTGEGEIKPIGADLEFQVHTVSCDLTFKDLIERLDVVKRAHAHPYWQRKGYPPEHTGFREVLPTGHGTFIVGSGIMLRDYTLEQEEQLRRAGHVSPPHRSEDKIQTLWPSSAGSAGEDKPRYIVRVPT